MIRQAPDGLPPEKVKPTVAEEPAIIGFESFWLCSAVRTDDVSRRIAVRLLPAEAHR